MSCKLTGLRKLRGCASHIALGQLQASKQHLTSNKSVIVFYLPCQAETLVRVLRCGLQVVPFVADAGQAQTRFTENRQRLITQQFHGAPVGLGRKMELVVSFLNVAQAGDTPGRGATGQ